MTSALELFVVSTMPQAGPPIQVLPIPGTQEVANGETRAGPFPRDRREHLRPADAGLPTGPGRQQAPRRVAYPVRRLPPPRHDRVNYRCLGLGVMLHAPPHKLS